MQNSHKRHMPCSGAIHMQVISAIYDESLLSTEFIVFTDGCCARGIPIDY